MKNLDTANHTLLWLKENFEGVNLNESNLQPLMGFLLLWGMFEGRNFNSDDKSPFVLRLVEKIKNNPLNASIEIVAPLFDYFHKRYVINEKGQEKLAKLNLAGGPKNLFGSMSAKEFVEATIANPDAELQQKLNCIFLIIYRFRNNLFHGRKNTANLNIYAVPFTKINVFMRNYLLLSIAK